MRETITVHEFAEHLWGRFWEIRKVRSEKKGCEIALSHGWMSPQDAKQAEAPIRRSDAARIMHEFLRWELGEPDDVDWGAAKELKDLYDCRVCAAHVAQMVCKGIMSVKGQVFGGKELLDRAEAAESIERLLEPSKRLQDPCQRQENASVFQQDSMKQTESSECEAAGESKTEHLGRRAVRLTSSEAMRLLQEREDLLFLDIRTAGEYETSHLKGAKSLPLLRLMTNPSCVGESRTMPILLGCDGGYRSEIAADCLSNAGYEVVYYFGWETEGSGDNF
jgi:rhodanese-related sulfurtransferase